MRFLGKNKTGQKLFSYEFQGSEVKQMADNQISIVGSTESRDRDNEVIKMSGWMLENYRKNPVILPAHQYWEPAIGKGEVKNENNKLVFTVTFPEKGINPLADVYRGLYKGGFMNASSVGFIGLDYQWGEKEGDPSRTFTKQELMELSLCSVPSNPTALVTDKSIAAALSAKKIDKNDVKALEDFIFRCFKTSKKGAKVFFMTKDDATGLVECPSCGDTFDENDGITGDDVGTDCMKCPTCGVTNPTGDYEQADKAIEDGRRLQEQSNITAERVKAIVEETIKEVIPGIVQESLKTILKNKSHYSSFLFNDQVPDGTTDSVAKELGESLKSKFKL